MERLPEAVAQSIEPHLVVMEATGIIIGVVGLMWDVYNKCNNDAVSFHDLQRDYRSLITLLHEAEKDLRYDDKLDPIRAGCRQIAVDIEKMLEKYANLGSSTSTRSPWQSLRWSLENIEQLRSRLIAQVVMLNASSNLSSLRGIQFEFQSQSTSTRSNQSPSAPMRDNDQIWYEIYQALHASNASESSLEAVRTLVLERSIAYMSYVDSTPIVVTPYTMESLFDTNNLPELSSSETRYSVTSSTSSFSTGKKKRRSLSAPFKSKKSKFIEAAKNGDMEALLQLQAQVDTKIIQKTLLEVAQSEDIAPGQSDMVRLLLNWGAHAEYPDSFYRRTPLISTIISQRPDLIDPLLDAGACLETRDGRRHNTPLIWAIYTYNDDIFRRLIDKNADTKVTDNITGYSPLLLAANLGFLNAARVLLERDRRLIEEKDRNGLMSLAIAYVKRHIASAELFLQYGDNKDFIWPSGQSLLATAIIENQTDFVRLLLDKGASITQINGVPALTAAVKQQVPTVVQSLLDKILVNGRAALEARDSRGGTALLWAVWLKNERIVGILVAAGADISVRDGNNVTIQHWAQWTKNKRILALVTQSGRDGYIHKAELPG